MNFLYALVKFFFFSQSFLPSSAAHSLKFPRRTRVNSIDNSQSTHQENQKSTEVVGREFDLQKFDRQNFLAEFSREFPRFKKESRVEIEQKNFIF